MPAPARRLTDRYLAVGFSGIAAAFWLIVARVAVGDDPGAALLYAVPAAMTTYAAGGTVWSLWRTRADRRRRAEQAELKNRDNHGLLDP